MSAKQYIVAGIDTEVGKTIISAALVETLNANYWKPIQSGALDQSDTISVKRLVTNYESKFYPESYAFKHAISPHAAGEKEGVEITLDEIHVPDSGETPLIIELAGGLMSPLSYSITNLDLVKKINKPLILVVKNYLGSINHTLLTLEVCKKHNIDVKGIIVNGGENLASQKVYESIGGYPILAKYPWLPTLDRKHVKEGCAALDGVL